MTNNQELLGRILQSTSNCLNNLLTEGWPVTRKDVRSFMSKEIWEYIHGFHWTPQSHLDITYSLLNGSPVTIVAKWSPHLVVVTMPMTSVSPEFWKGWT